MPEQSVAVKLAAEIVYVAGTVNGQAASWQLYAGHIWRAVVSRAESCVYEVSLECYDELGRMTPYSITLRYGLNLITDRTAGDVARVKYLNAKWSGGEWTGTAEELAEWAGNPKGAYNAEDLNRVGAAVRFLADLLLEYGYGLSGMVQTRTDWTEEDIPTRSDMETYLNNIRALMDCYHVLPTTPALPENMDRLGHQGANDIEKVLLDLYFLVQNMAAAWFYCGDIESGEV